MDIDAEIERREAESFGLNRFQEAQREVYGDVIAELKNGSKKSHWMWFIFPQLRGLGTSSVANYFGIRSLAEANAYLKDPVLGSRLLECTHLVLALKGCVIEEVFGSPDYLKFCSSMTLFELVAGDEGCFAQALEQFYAGERDSRTLDLVRRMQDA